MRKVLSFALVLSLVLGSFSFAFAGTTATTVKATDIAGKTCEDAVNVLSELNVVTGYPDGTYKPENIVTRAEMAVIIIKAMGLEGYATGKSTFKDMAGYDWAQKYVGYAQSRGIIAGYPDGTFKPAQTVSYNEAAKMLVAALGYPQSVLIGTWPSNYVSKAQDLGILDDINASAAGANRGDIAVMTYQTLDVPMVRVDNENKLVNIEGEWDATANGGAGAYAAVTLMTKLGASDYDADTITAGTQAEFVVLGNEDTVINLMPYYGKLVKAYANSDDEIIAIKEVKSTQLTGEYDAAENDFEVGTTEYDLVGANFNAGKINEGEYLNGATTEIVADGVVAALVDGNTYTLNVDLSGITIKKVYSSVTWTVTNADQVTASQIASIKNSDKLLGKAFKKGDDGEIDLTSFELVGAASLNDIKVDDVVCIYANAAATPTITKIGVSNKIVTGEVTKIKGAGVDAKYTIGGVEYKYYTGVGTMAAAPAVGDEVKAYLTHDSKIFDTDKISGEADKIGVILSLGNKTGVAINSYKDLQLELFLSDGTTKTFVVDPDEYDGGATDGVKAFTGAVAAAPVTDLVAIDAVGSALTTATWNEKKVGVNPATGSIEIGTAVEYDLNKDGQINSLKVVAWDAAMVAAKDLTTKKTFNGFTVNDDALIISYTDRNGILPYTNDDDDYAVEKLDELLDSSLVNAYYTTDTNGKIDFLYISSASTSTKGIYGVMTDAEKNNSTAGYGIDMLVAGAAKFYNTDTDNRAMTSLAKKSLYKITTDASGDATLAAHALPGANCLTVTAALAPTVNGSVVTYTGGKATLESDVAVYVWNVADDAYELGDTTDIEDIAGTTSSAKFFDTETGADADGIFNVVLVSDDTATAVSTVLPAVGALANGSYSLIFSEAIDAASRATVKAAVDAKLTVTGAGAVSTAWNVAGTTLTITVTGVAVAPAGTAAIAAVAAQTVTDMSGNVTAGLVIQ